MSPRPPELKIALRFASAILPFLIPVGYYCNHVTSNSVLLEELDKRSVISFINTSPSRLYFLAVDISLFCIAGEARLKESVAGIITVN